MQKLRLRLLAALSMDPTGMSILLGLVTSIALGMLLGAWRATWKGSLQRGAERSRDYSDAVSACCASQAVIAR